MRGDSREILEHQRKETRARRGEEEKRRQEAKMKMIPIIFGNRVLK